MENYKLYLYKPNATGDNFLGELLVDNLQVNIKLHEMSSISFTIPENVNGVANQRLDEVLDGYVVELWYGRVTGVENTDYFKMRFILHTTPLEFNDFKRTYTYEGFSFESILEFKQIDNWAGVKTKDFYREMTYDNSTTDQYTEVAATGETIPNHPYSVTAKTVGTGNYIRIVPTTATATPLDIYVYEVREDTSTQVYNQIPYVRYTGATYDEANFKQGYYFLDMDVNNEYVEYIYIYVPDNYADFDSQAANKKLRFKVYDNPISRHYAIGVNRNDENPYTNMYIDLAQDVEDGDAAEYGDYTFVTQSVYSKNGLKLEHVLLGNIESRNAGLIDNNTLTIDGLLYNTDFTIGTIHADIAAKYRSNLEYNNITVYQAIRDLAESFDAIPVFDTILKTVSFYPENADTWPNNGLILKYGTYLKTINKDIDASKIVTAAKGIGKDNLSIALITPDGSNSWQDFSYYLDEFYIDPELSLSELNALGFEFTLETSSGLNYLGISYPNSDDTSGYQSRWMEAAEAKKVAKWQFNRDFMHRVLLGEIRPSDVDYGALNLTALNRYYDLYNIRSEAINEYVQSETVLSVKKAESFRYKYLYDYYEKLIIAGSTAPEDLERLNYYKNLWTETQSLISSQETALEQKRVAIFETTVADSIGDKMGELRTILNKVTIYSINISKLNPFIKEVMVSDTKFDNELDLLEAVITHVNENKIPRITINVSIVDILAAQEAYDDWNKLRVGDLVNIYYPEFNIDVEVQIREVSINFEAHNASIVISSVRNYNKSYANYVSKVIKRLSITEKNVVNNLQDANRTSSSESNENYKTLNGGQISTAKANIIFGSKNSGGTSSTSFSGSGFESKTVQSVDPLTESFNFGVDKYVVIKDGTILAYYRDDTDTFTSEVEISADKGFEIRKITGSLEGEDLLSVRKVYIDTNGNAVFSGTVNANAGNFTSTVSIGSGATSGTINVGTDTNKIVITGTNNDETTKIYSGTGTYNNSNTGFYLDATGRFSLGDQLYWDGTTLTILGDIQADTGTIGGFSVGADYIRAADVNTKLLLKHNANTPYLSIGQSTNAYDQNGIFLGMVSDGQPTPTYTPRLSLKSATNSLLWDGTNLTIDGGGTFSGALSAATGTFGAVTIDAAGSITIGNTVINNNGIIAKNSSAETKFSIDPVTGAMISIAGQIGGWTIGANSLTGGSATLQSSGNLTLGTSNDVIRLSADDATYRIWAGNATAASAPFSVTKGGVLTSTSGSIGGWTINSDGIFTGTFDESGYTTSGITISNNGSIHSENFYLDNTGITTKAGSIGGWTISTDNLSSSGLELYSGASPYLSISQATNGYANDGIFLGVDSSQPKFSMVTDSGNTYLKYNPSATYDLEIAGNAKIGPLLIGNTSSPTANISFTQDGTGDGYTSFTSLSGVGPKFANVTFNFTQGNLKSFIFPYDNNFNATIAIRVYLRLASTAIKTLYYFASPNSGGNISESNINIICDEISIESQLYDSVGGSFYIGGLAGDDFTFVETLPLISLTNFAAYANGTVYSNTFQTTKMSISSSTISTSASGQSIELISENVKIKNQNISTTADSITIQASSSTGTNSRAVTLTTPATALSANRTIRFPDAAGTLSLIDTTQTVTGAQTFRNASGIRVEADATQDAIVIDGRAGGTSSYEVTLIPSTLSADRTITLPDTTGTVAITNQSNGSIIGSWTLIHNATATLTSTDATTVSTVTLDTGTVTNTDTIVLQVDASNSSTTSSYEKAYIFVRLGTNQTTINTPLTSWTALDNSTTGNPRLWSMLVRYNSSTQIDFRYVGYNTIQTAANKTFGTAYVHKIWKVTV